MESPPAIPLTRQGVRNLNPSGPKKKKPEPAVQETEPHDDDAITLPGQVVSDADVVPTPAR